MMLAANQNDCGAHSTVHLAAMMGHNNPPPEKVIKPQPDSVFGLRAAWLRFAEQREIVRLAKLHGRIKRKEEALKRLRAERTTIMNRCIRRMRRASGKN
jgi:hypothetical protein